MKFYLLLFVIIALYGTSSMAEQKMKKLNLNNELINDEWIGAEQFALALKQQSLDSCKYISETNSKYSETSFIIRRILAISEKTKCKERMDLVSTHLTSPDVLVRAAAIRLAARFGKKEKTLFRKQIEEINRTDSDPAIQEAALKFIKN